MMNQTTANRLAARHIPTGARCILEHSNGSALYTYEMAGKLYAIAFWGTAGRSMFHYRYNTEAQRQEKVLSFKDAVESSVASKLTRRAEKCAAVNTLKVSDILHTCWGYDQTNTEFYVVTSVSGKRVKVAKIAADYESTGNMTGKTWPSMPIRIIGKESMHIAQGSGENVYVRLDSCRRATLEAGREHYVSSYA